MPEVTVAVVLNGVIGSAEDDGRDLGPRILYTDLHDVKDPGLFLAP